jgi:ubiquinone/menaquinone biosynthesis C-methylase UbiE
MGNPEDHSKLKEIYQTIAFTKDERTTACDFNLRELEIDTALSYIQDGHKVLDVGCGLGYALRQYAARRRIEGFGIDYAENMIEGCRQLQIENRVPLRGAVEFRHASVLDLPFENDSFDVVTSSRCLMALLDWELQKNALVEIARVLKPSGVLVLMEGTLEGLARLNEVRTMFGLTPIDESGRDRLCTLKFKEGELLRFAAGHYQLERIQRFGMYYFLTRVVHPLLVAPDPPRYDARINEIARDIARTIPDLMGLGHLAAFIFRKPG